MNQAVEDNDLLHQGDQQRTGAAALWWDPCWWHVLVGRVDPRLLSGTDPVYDHYSLVGVTEGSVFASGQKQSGVGMSQLAPRFAKVAPAVATVSSGRFAAQVLKSTNTVPHENDEILWDLVLDVANESWNHDILNNSGDRSGYSFQRINPNEES